ncbi:MAG: oxaloacetate decarboxylase [Phycisphaerales bacterium JB039]
MPDFAASGAPGQRLRRLMDDHCVLAPGAFNGLCARAIADAGFEAAYVSGAAISVCAGVPDVGLLTLDHFARVVREVVDGTKPPGGAGPALPVICDADTGFGEAEMVRRTVIEYARAGAAGLHLEDQQFPKRCGHLDGKALVPLDHMVEKVQWAAAAARDAGGGFIICARTDARGVEGLDAAIERASAYVRAGADMIFPEGLTSEGEFGAFAAQLREQAARPIYLLANMTEFGKTPMLRAAQFGELGYDLVIYPVSALRAAMGAAQRMLADLKRDGSVEAHLEQMQTRKELYRLIGYQPGTPWKMNA